MNRIVEIEEDSELLQFIVHKGQHVVIVDFSNNTAEEMTADLKEVGDFLEAQTEKKLCVVENLTDVMFNREVVETAKKMWSDHGHRIHRIATIGIEGLKTIPRDEVEEASKLELRNFEKIDEALDYVVEGKPPETVTNCWEYMGCSVSNRENCPAFNKEAGHICWLVAGTLCEDGESQGMFIDKVGDCRECKWYKWNMHGQATEACENVLGS